MAYDFNFESTVKLWLYQEYATVLNIYHQLISSTGPIPRAMFDRYNEAFDAAYFYLEYFDAKMARAFSQGSFDELNLSLFLGNDALNYIDVLGFEGVGTSQRSRAAKERRSQNGREPSGPTGPSPKTAAKVGSVAKNVTKPTTTRTPSALGGAVSKVGGGAVGLGIQTATFLSEGDNAQNVAQGIGAPMSRNKLIDAYASGDISYDEFQDGLEKLKKKLCK